MMAAAPWPHARLDAVGSVATGGTPPTTDRSNYGRQHLFVSPADLGRTKYVRTSAKMLSAKGFAGSRRVPAGSTLFVCIGSTIGKVGLAGEDLATNQQINSIIPNGSVDPEFLFYATSTLSAIVREQAGEQAVPLVNKSQFSEFEIPMPPLVEQKEIATALADADDLITTLERLIAKKQAIKQGMMQQLLTGRTRLPGFTGSWSMRKIGDFAEVRAGGTPSTSVSEFWGGEIPWMSSGEIHKKRVFDVNGRITTLGLQKSSAHLFPRRTVLMALAGQGKTRGTVAISHIDLTTNQSIAGIYPSSEHDPDYLYYNLDTRYSELRGESTGDGGRGGLNLTIIKNVEVPFPKVSEQRAIAAVLADVDNEVSALSAQLTKARAIKTGMMQQLLTGRTRLPVEAAS